MEPIITNTQNNRHIVTITKEFCFTARHFVKLPDEDTYPHVDKFTVKLYLEGELNDHGIVVGFNKIGNICKEFIREYDNTDLNEIIKQPTNENIVKFVFLYFKYCFFDELVKIELVDSFGYGAIAEE